MYLKKSLSVVLITKNEEKILPGCLESVIWADEIIILDSNSHDSTCQIGAQLGAKVFHSMNWNGFGEQRRKAQSYASSDYILMLDADERVTIPLRHAIEKVLKKPEPNTVYGCKRYSLFINRFMRKSGWYPDLVVRLYDRELYHYNTLTVHESLETNGSKIVPLCGYLQHLTCIDFTVFQRKQLEYAEAWAIEKHRLGQKCSFFSIIKHTYSAFLKTWLLKAGILEGKHGWMLSIANSQYTFNKYAFLWALNNPIKVR